MAKRTRQATLLDILPKKMKKSDAPSIETLAESDIELVCSDTGADSEDDSCKRDVENDKSHSASTSSLKDSSGIFQGNDPVSHKECDSLCCVDISQPFQPKDKETILSMVKDKRNFMVDWYIKYPWLTVCTSQCKVFCFYCKVIEKQNMLTFSKKKEMTFTMHGFNN